MRMSQARARFLLHGPALSGLLAVVSLATAAPADAPYSADIFVRGSFNDWDLSDPMKYDAPTNRYVGLVELSPGVVHQFKIASQDWFSVDLGDFVDPVVNLSVPKTLATSPGGGNLALEVPAEGVYSFTLDPADLVNPVLTVVYARPGGEGEQNGAQIWHGTYGLIWYFPCLGQTVDATVHVKAELHVRSNPAGGFLYSENLQTSGTAVDSGGGTYFVRDARINNYLAQPGGGQIFQKSSRLRMTSHGAGTDLLVTMIERWHIDADGNVVRDFYFEDFTCGQ
jgi:hypothetical protein